jgi:O-methyltransferase involved in polyketide biosynthesis
MSNTKVNIVSLGAGYDTTYWWLRENLGEEATTSAKLDYIEVDFDEVVRKKILTINKNPCLKNLLQTDSKEMGSDEISVTDEQVLAPAYKLFSSDIRDEAIMRAKLTSMGVDPSLPTLVLTECLMIYLKGMESLAAF